MKIELDTDKIKLKVSEVLDKKEVKETIEKVKTEADKFKLKATKEAFKLAVKFPKVVPSLLKGASKISKMFGK